jgi:hypothetical protein
MNDSLQFPFALELNAIDKWLTTINPSDTIQLSTELHQIVKNLNQASLDTNLLFEIISRLTPIIVNLSSELEQIFFSEIHPLDAEPHKLGRLSLHLIRELVTSYHKIATDKRTSDEQFLLSSHRALHLIGHHMRLSAKISERPSSISWKISAQLYLLANKKGISTSLRDEKIQAFNSNTSIINLLKRNLLFAICNPYRLIATEIDALFPILTDHCQLSDLGETMPEAASNFCFVLEYRSSTAPGPVLQGKHYSSAVFIETTQLMDYFQSSKFEVPFASFENILLRLSGYQNIMESDIPSAPEVGLLVSGFDQIIPSLNEQIRKSNIQQLSNDFSENDALVNARLEPLDIEPIFMASNKSNFHLFEGQKNNLTKILKTRHPDYIIAVSTPTKYAIDNLVLIINENNSPETGIIRRVLNIAQSNTMRVLIELIPGIGQCTEIFETKFAGPAILISQSSQIIEVLLPPNSYVTGSKLLIGENLLMLKKLTEITPYFMRYRVKTIL